jgi:hypothetical protein
VVLTTITLPGGGRLGAGVGRGEPASNSSAPAVLAPAEEALLWTAASMAACTPRCGGAPGPGREEARHPQRVVPLRATLLRTRGCRCRRYRRRRDEQGDQHCGGGALLPLGAFAEGHSRESPGEGGGGG